MAKNLQKKLNFSKAERGDSLKELKKVNSLIAEQFLLLYIRMNV